MWLQLLISSTMLFVTSKWYTLHFLTQMEKRSNLVVLPDPVLSGLPTIDTSLIISVASVINIGCIFVFFSISRLIIYFWSMILFMLFRSLCLYLTPLKVHPSRIVLRDRVLTFIGFHENPLENDLFFSGHLSHLLVVACVFPETAWLLYPLAIVVSVCLILVKAHYCIDILVVPFIIPQIVSFARSL